MSPGELSPSDGIVTCAKEIMEHQSSGRPALAPALESSAALSLAMHVVARPLGHRFAHPLLIVAALTAVIVSALSIPSSAPAAVGGLQLLDSSSSGLTFEVGTQLGGVETPSVAGSEGLLIEDTWHRSVSIASDVAVPRIPMLVAVPPGHRVRLEVEVLASSPLSLTQAQSNRLAALLPDHGIETAEPSYWREQRCVSLGYLPFTFENGQWRYVASARFTARFDRLSGDRSVGTVAGVFDSPAARRAGHADAFEDLYRDMIINYEDGRAWRRPVSNARARRGGSPYFSSTSQPWIRITTDREGIYEVRGSDLLDLGLDLEDVDPLSLRLFAPAQLPLPPAASYDQVPAWMNERPITVEGGGDGAFDAADRIIFLGSAPDDWYTNKGTSPPGLEAFAFDPYANEDVYWLTWGGSFPEPPARVSTVDGSEVFKPYVDRVRDRVHIETNGRFDAFPRDSNARWERYWTRRVTGTSDGITEEVLPTEPLPGALVSEPVDVFVRLWGANDPDSGLDPAPPDHDVEMLLDDSSLFREQWEGRRRRDLTASGVFLDASFAGQHRFEMRIHPHDDPTINRLDIVLLAFIDIEYSRRLVAQDNRLEFFAGGLSGGHSLELSGWTADDVGILDVTDPFEPVWVTPQTETSGTERILRFRTQVQETVPSRFLARSLADLERPGLEIFEMPPGGYLRERTDAVQMIILTDPRLRAEADELAAFRRENLPDREVGSVEVVEMQEIFDEFSFGRKDVAAIRNFLQFARDAWTGGNPEDGPAYVVFFGDAHYDYRSLSANVDDFVSTYAEYYSTGLGLEFDPRFSSDDYFVLLDGPEDSLLDMAIGRLVAASPAEARVMVEKIKRYETDTELAEWKNDVTLVADDICQTFSSDGLGWTHNRQTETLATQVFPKELHLEKIYLVEYGGTECVFTQKPGANSALLQSMNEGTLVVNFTGHGSETQVADERVFDLQDVPGLSNRDRLFLFLTASCSVGKYDRSSLGLGEELIRHEGGGAVVVFSAASVAGSLGNSLVNQAFFSNVFPSGHPGSSRPVGEAAVTAKMFASGINQRRFVLHGDPATRLVAPALDAELELVNTSGGGASLERGAKVRLTGTVEVPLEGPPFEGTAMVQVHDSQVLRQPTPGIDGNDYVLEGSTIFRGRVPVRAGVFQTEFLVPTALRTGARGTAEVRVYFEDGTRDGSAVISGLEIPETAAPPTDDLAGPQIGIEFDDDTEAVPPQGRVVVSFADSSGVNITGLVPSRSVVLRVEDGGDLVVAEDIAELVDFGDDFRTAQAELRLPADLTEGRRYELVVEASDNVNNRSSARTTFFLSSSGGGSFQVETMYNFPNPTEGATRFYAEIIEESDVDVQVFTMTGRRIVRLGPARLSPRELSGQGLEWDGRDADGDVLGNGVYLYKLTARSLVSGRTASRVDKLVVSR